jgi:hypothetical protein
MLIINLWCNLEMDIKTFSAIVDMLNDYRKRGKSAEESLLQKFSKYSHAQIDKNLTPVSFFDQVLTILITNCSFTAH